MTVESELKRAEAAAAALERNPTDFAALGRLLVAVRTLRIAVDADKRFPVPDLLAALKGCLAAGEEGRFWVGDPRHAAASAAVAKAEGRAP